MNNFKLILKELTPPILVKIFRKKNKDWGWFGKIKTWPEAVSQSSGYDADYILEKMQKTFRRLRDGEDLFERDSILQVEKRYNYPLLFSLSWIALQEKQKINILDFGGSFGSAYYWVKDFLKPNSEIKWSIIEQAHIVRAGKKEFENNNLRFYEDFESCFKDNNPDILLLSGVLQYIEDPAFLIKEINNQKFSYIIIDRSPFFENDECPSQITIQKIGEYMYGKITTVPCRIYNKSFLISELEKDYEVILDSPNFDDLTYNFYGDNFYFRFVFLRRKDK